MQRSVMAMVVAIALAAPGLAGAKGEGSITGMFGNVDATPNDFTLYTFFFNGKVEISPRWDLFGGFAVTHVRSDAEDGTALSNIVVGADYYFRANPSYQAWLSASLGVPIGNDTGDAGLANALTGALWIPDRGLFQPFTTSVRVHGNFRLGQVRKHLKFILGGEYFGISEGEDVMRLLMIARGRLPLANRVGIFGEFGTVANLPPDNPVDDIENFLRAGLELIPRGGGVFDISFYLPLEAQVDGFSILVGFTTGF